MVSCLPFSRLAGARELTEFEVVISGKIMGNPWESCRSQETMQPAPLNPNFSENARAPSSFILLAELQGRRTGKKTLVQ